MKEHPYDLISTCFLLLAGSTAADTGLSVHFIMNGDEIRGSMSAAAAVFGALVTARCMVADAFKKAKADSTFGFHSQRPESRIEEMPNSLDNV